MTMMIERRRPYPRGWRCYDFANSPAAEPCGEGGKRFGRAGRAQEPSLFGSLTGGVFTPEILRRGRVVAVI